MYHKIAASQRGTPHIRRKSHGFDLLIFFTVQLILAICLKNTLDLFKIVYDANIMSIVLRRMTQNQKFCGKYLNDDDFRRKIEKMLLPLVHERMSHM